MPNCTTPAAGGDVCWILSDRWQREQRTMSRKECDEGRPVGSGAGAGDAGDGELISCISSGA